MVPPAKKPRTEEGAEAGAEADAAMEAEEPKEPTELEVDAPKCTKQKMKGSVEFLLQDTTLNVMMSASNNTFMSLAEGGMHHLLAGARANVGISKGRYMFEVKVIEFTAVADSYSKGQKHTLKVGFATSASSLFLGDTAESICFESLGSVLHNKTRTKACPPFAVNKHSVLGVLLNLEPGPNANTISLFVDGVRASQPHALPDALKGKALHPCINYKNITAHVNFGPETICPLPFKCRMLQDAAQADIVVAKADAPADGKYEVVFPVGLPDEGTFDRLDQFLKKNPKHMEISERMIMDWVEKSGVPKSRTARTSNDKPEKGFGVKELDDDSIRRAVLAVAPMQGRHYVVMEIKRNLIEDDRKALLAQWPEAMFKRIADVAVGSPPPEYKAQVQKAVLEAKQQKAERAWELKKLEKLRQKKIAKQKKEAEKARQKALKLAKKKQEEAKKKMEEAKKKAEEAKKKAEEAKKRKEEGLEEAEEEKKEDEEMKEEEQKAVEEEEEEEEEAEEEEPEEPEEPMPKEELTAEEKALSFRPLDIADLKPMVLSSNFAKFTIPKKDEGFDDVRFEWAKGAQAEQYVKQWIQDKKINSRVEELKPSAWFRTRVQEWQKSVAQWKQKQTEYTASVSKKQSERASKKGARERNAVKLAALAAAKAKADEARKEKGTEPTEKELEAETKAAEAAEAAKKKEAEEVEKEAEEVEAEERAEADFKTLDIFGADDINDVGGGIPLFKDFRLEDWTLMELLFELNLLVHAFTHDVEDAQRPGIHIKHLAFYFKKYYGKELRPQDFGVETLQDVVNLIGDKILFVTQKELLGSQLDGDFESLAVFPKLIELARRDRRIRADLGEESAVLKLSGRSGASGGWGGQRSAFGRSSKSGGKGGGKASGGKSSGGKAAGKAQVGKVSGLPMLSPRFSKPSYGGGKGGFRRW